MINLNILLLISSFDVLSASIIIMGLIISYNEFRKICKKHKEDTLKILRELYLDFISRKEQDYSFFKLIDSENLYVALNEYVSWFDYDNMDIVLTRAIRFAGIVFMIAHYLLKYYILEFLESKSSILGLTLSILGVLIGLLA